MIGNNSLRGHTNCICDTSENGLEGSMPLAEERLAVLGHEIRNPLSALSYALQAWPSTTDDPQLTEHLLQIMRRQVAQLTRLCNDLMDTGRCSKGNLSICQAAIDVRHAVQNACEEIRPFADQCGHTITVTLGEVPLTLFGDESRLTQVFANLMQNSAKFTARGGHLHVSLERDQDWAVIRLSDNGRGICAERLQSIFLAENVTQKCPEAVGGGLGIGLRLAKSLVELHGGTIEAFSKGLGHGCTFVIRLPMFTNKSTATTDASSQHCATLRELGEQLPQFKIVVVDDNRSIRFLMLRLLESLNQSVTTADNGDAAIESIIRIQPHVVFLDLQMHGMSGYEVARQIRSRFELRKVVLIALSGSVDAESRSLATESGFDEYLVKPASIAELREILQHIGELSTC